MMRNAFPTLALIFLCSVVPIISGLAFTNTPGATTAGESSSSSSITHFFDPAQRDSHYGNPLNVAQYLVDLHDAKAGFDFCGGIMFQLVLTKSLRDHLVKEATATAESNHKQPFIFDASKSRMFSIPDYAQKADADNVRLFHGREIRSVPHATGGRGFVLQLSMADSEGDDPEGWTQQEVAGYDGWGHDTGRIWRKGNQLEEEGFKTFKQQFGDEAFALHHRFYLHFDRNNRMWLSAEDGCEGTPAASPLKREKNMANLFGIL